MAKVFLVLFLIIYTSLNLISCEKNAPHGFKWEIKGLIFGEGKFKGYAKLDKNNYLPGEKVNLEFNLEIQSKLLAINKDEIESFVLVVAAERVFDERGIYHSFTNHLMSSVLTPTGLPVENFQYHIPSKGINSPYTTPLDLSATIPLWEAYQGKDKFVLKYKVSGNFLPITPPGFYRLYTDIYLKRGKFFIKLNTAGIYLKPKDKVKLRYGNPHDFAYTFIVSPLFKVGKPSTPKMIWALVNESPNRGLTAIISKEDSSHFQLSNRVILPTNKMVIYQGRYLLEPCFPTIFGDQLFNFHCKTINPINLNYRSGELHIVITRPDGGKEDLGKAPFKGKSKLGATTKNPRFLYHFNQYGKYTILMEGFIEDDQGNRLNGGGTYEVWCGPRLTFSTPSKPGRPFLVGQEYPPAVEVNPPVPAKVDIEILFYPYSDPSKERKVHIEGYCNINGILQLPRDRPRMVFDEPGEYRVDITAIYEDTGGMIWIGNQGGASVVAPIESEIVAHGLKFPAQGPDLPFQDRFNLNYEGIRAILPGFKYNCLELTYPYNSGDVLYISSPNNAVNSIAAYLSYEERKPSKLTEFITEKFPLSIFPLWYPVCDVDFPISRDDYYQMGCFQYEKSQFISGYENFSDQLPLLSVAKYDLQPFNYTEFVEFQSYFYASSIRPGLSTMNIVGDSTAFSAYWVVSPNSFAGQFGGSADLETDIYRFNGGVVVKDFLNGKAYYDVYASAGIVLPAGSNSCRIVRGGEEPLFELYGNKHYFILAPAVARIYQAGDYISLGGFMLPPLPVEGIFEVTDPDGNITIFRGMPDRLGEFNLPSARIHTSKPGVYQIRFQAKYEGKTGSISGARPGGVWHHYVDDEDKTALISFPGLHNTAFSIDQPFKIIGLVNRGIIPIKISYSLISAGFLLDDGTLPIMDGKFEYPINLIDLKMQFPALSIEDGRLMDQLFLVFFLEGISEGKPVYDARKITLRENRIICFEPDALIIQK